ncbi:hypothetical protein GCM10023212_40050 [Luteolibacter yonseiensis]
MQNAPVSPHPSHLRTQCAGDINRVMTRFPLIVQILKELRETQIPLPGDNDIRHGCERALTSMLSELARIETAPAGNFSKDEETAQSWLHCPDARQFIDADVLQRMQIFIDFILDPKAA